MKATEHQKIVQQLSDEHKRALDTSDKTINAQADEIAFLRKELQDSQEDYRQLCEDIDYTPSTGSGKPVVVHVGNEAKKKADPDAEAEIVPYNKHDYHRTVNGTFTITITTTGINRATAANLLQATAASLDYYGANRQGIYLPGDTSARIGFIDFQLPPDE